MKPAPLAAVRVLEQGQLLAVPYAARLLADLGAEVIKLESPLRLDTHRQTTYPNNEPGDAHWDRGGTFFSENRGKFGIVLDLRRPEAIAVVHDLVRVSDVVMENFTSRVMQTFGLDYRSLLDLRPDLIMLSSTGYGHSGPWTNYSAVGPTTEAASGLAALSGYRGGNPVIPDIPYTDYVAAEQAVLAVLLALFKRRRTGRGSYIDLAQAEAQSAIAGELLLEAAANRPPPEPRGNRHPAMAPHGFFPCLGNDRWIAIAVSSDAEWQALCEQMGRPAWMQAAALAHLDGRKQHEDEIEQRLAQWTRSEEAGALMQRLQRAGVPAGVASDGRDLILNEQLRSRGFFSWLEHPAHSGISAKPYPGAPWRFSESARGEQRRAPALGEHTTAVLRDLLGYDDRRLASLEDCGALRVDPAEFPRPSPVPVEELVRQGRVVDVDPDFEERIRPPS